MEEKEKNNIFVLNKDGLRISVKLIIISLILYGGLFCFNKIHRYMQNPIDYAVLVEENNIPENAYISIRVTDIIRLNDSMDCLLKDYKGNFLMARLTKQTIENISTKKQNEYYLEGYIFYFNSYSMLKRMDEINKNATDFIGESDVLYLSNYVHETKPAYEGINLLVILIGIFFDMLAIYSLLMYFISYIILKLYMKKFDINELKEALANKTTKVFEVSKRETIYITNKYFIQKEVYNTSGWSIIAFSELYWVYIENYRFR